MTTDARPESYATSIAAWTEGYPTSCSADGAPMMSGACESATNSSLAYSSRWDLPRKKAIAATPFLPDAAPDTPRAACGVGPMIPRPDDNSAVTMIDSGSLGMDRIASPGRDLGWESIGDILARLRG